MACARGRHLRAVLAGVIVCWAVAEGIAVAQDASEVAEDLGNSYVLTRRTTGQGSIIETLLFAGRPIVTDIAVPATDMGTTAASARTLSGSADAPPRDAAAPPAGFGPGFGGTWLTGETVGDYLVLHRIRAGDPVTHDIFHDGRKVGSVSEVGPPVRTGSLAGRNSFAFESTDDRFVVRLTQPDGTRILAATEHGHFLGQVVVDRSAAIAAPWRSGVGVAAPSEPSLEAVGPSIDRSPQPQRLARPQKPAGSIMREEPAPQVIPLQPETAPLPRPSPLPRTRPALGATPVRTVGPAGNNLSGSTPQPIAAPAAATAPRPVAPASAITAPAAAQKPAAAATRRPAATPATPIVPAPATTASAANAKPVAATENSRPARRSAAKPPTPAARPLRAQPSDSWLEELERATRPGRTETP